MVCLLQANRVRAFIFSGDFKRFLLTECDRLLPFFRSFNFHPIKDLIPTEQIEGSQTFYFMHLTTN